MSGKGGTKAGGDIRAIVKDWRNWAVTGLMAAGILAAIAVPSPGMALTRWLLLLVASKAAAALCVWGCVALCRRWETGGNYLSNIIKKED